VGFILIKWGPARAGPAQQAQGPGRAPLRGKNKSFMIYFLIK